MFFFGSDSSWPAPKNVCTVCYTGNLT
ncbi:hypothetical protein AHF37_12323 [Paragonimus kellicotti]|nr:hypothetical protein AHF37_12323 [Paragonimus kellicotti]